MGLMVESRGSSWGFGAGAAGIAEIAGVAGVARE